MRANQAEMLTYTTLPPSGRATLQPRSSIRSGSGFSKSRPASSRPPAVSASPSRPLVPRLTCSVASPTRSSHRAPDPRGVSPDHPAAVLNAFAKFDPKAAKSRSAPARPHSSHQSCGLPTSPSRIRRARYFAHAQRCEDTRKRLAERVYVRLNIRQTNTLAPSRAVKLHLCLGSRASTGAPAALRGNGGGGGAAGAVAEVLGKGGVHTAATL